MGLNVGYGFGLDGEMGCLRRGLPESDEGFEGDGGHFGGKRKWEVAVEVREEQRI